MDAWGRFGGTVSQQFLTPAIARNPSKNKGKSVGSLGFQCNHVRLSARALR